MDFCVKHTNCFIIIHYFRQETFYDLAFKTDEETAVNISNLTMTMCFLMIFS